MDKAVGEESPELEPLGRVEYEDRAEGRGSCPGDRNTQACEVDTVVDVDD